MNTPTPKTRPESSFLNYAVALLALCALVAGAVLLFSPSQEERISPIDYTPEAFALSTTAPYTAYVPEDLPEDWLPTSSRLDLGGGEAGGEPTEPVVWDVGFATPQDEYASLRIGDADPEAFIAEHTENAEPVGTEEQVDGQTWQRYANEEGRVSLVRELDDATLVVTGTADYPELAVLAGSLEPRVPREDGA